MIINTTSYSKARLYSADGDHGYGPVTKNGPAKRAPEEIYSIIIHTTNGKVGTNFEDEAGFIYTSKDISAHYLTGKHGQVVQFLDPTYIAWHAGAVNDPDCSNYHSIGIENHITVGEQWTETMHTTLTELVTWLLQQFTSIRKIVTHRSVAVFPPGHARAGQLGRKIDPSGWEDTEFAIWSHTLLLPSAAPHVETPNQAQAGILLAAPSKTQAQLIEYTIKSALNSRSPYTAFDIASIIRSYWTYALQAGIDPALLVAQMLHETGNLSSWWSARPRRNPAGIGVTGEVARRPPDTARWQYDQAHGEWKKGYAFASWDVAARAHVGHLLCYALTDSAMNEAQRALSSASPRKSGIPASYRGCATSIVDLNGKWAVPGRTYGQSILAIVQAMP